MTTLPHIEHDALTACRLDEQLRSRAEAIGEMIGSALAIVALIAIAVAIVIHFHDCGLLECLSRWGIL